jgi:hypothetical protein
MSCSVSLVWDSGLQQDTNTFFKQSYSVDNALIEACIHTKWSGKGEVLLSGVDVGAGLPPKSVLGCDALRAQFSKPFLLAKAKQLVHPIYSIPIQWQETRVIIMKDGGSYQSQIQVEARTQPMLVICEDQVRILPKGDIVELLYSGKSGRRWIVAAPLSPTQPTWCAHAEPQALPVDCSPPPIPKGNTVVLEHASPPGEAVPRSWHVSGTPQIVGIVWVE